MITCPNKSSKSWKKLVEARGESVASNLWFLYDGIVPETEYNKETKLHQDIPKEDSLLNNKLLNFLNKLNVTVEFKDDLRSSNYDALSLTDLLYKAVQIRNDYKNKGLVKETAYVAYSFLGKKNKIRTDLISSIENIENYQEIYNKYKERSPKLADYKIKELIVIDFLADAIKNNYEAPKDSYINREADYWTIKGNSKLEKKIKYHLNQLKRFIKNLFNYGKLNAKDLNDLFDSIANDVLNGTFNKFGNELSKEQQLTNYEETIAKDEKAKEIVENFQKLGLLLTGSLSLRKQGTLYRNVDENLHDLDFTVTSDKHGDYFNSLLKDLQDRINAEEKVNLTYGISMPIIAEIEYKKFFKTLQEKYKEHPLLKQIKEIYPEFEITATFKGLKDRELTVSGKIGNHIIDLFFVNDLKLDKTETSFQDWQDIFVAKIKMGRVKDIRDFANYIPFSPIKTKIAQTVGFRHFNFKEKIAQEVNSINIPSSNTLQNNNNFENLKNISKKVEKIC